MGTTETAPVTPHHGVMKRSGIAVSNTGRQGQKRPAAHALVRSEICNQHWLPGTASDILNGVYEN